MASENLPSIENANLRDKNDKKIDSDIEGIMVRQSNKIAGLNTLKIICDKSDGIWTRGAQMGSPKIVQNSPKTAQGGVSRVQSLISGFSKQAYTVHRECSLTTKRLEGERTGHMTSDGNSRLKLTGMSPKASTLDRKPKSSSKKQFQRVSKCQSNKISKYFNSTNKPTEKVNLEVGNRTDQQQTSLTG